MEDAIKAFCMVSILIICVGMYVYNSATSSLDTAINQMNASEIQEFNRQFTQFLGEQSGGNLKALLSRVIVNASDNKENNEKLPDIFSIDFKTGNRAPISVVSDVNDVNISGINAARSNLLMSHAYFVNVIYDEDTGLVTQIIINWNSDNSGFENKLYTEGT